MEGIYTVASSSSSATYGNVMCAIKEMLLTGFPPNYFNYTYVSTELAFYSLKRFLGPNTDNELRKKELPYLTIKPTFPVPNGDGFMYDTPLTKNYDNTTYGIDRRELFPILKDETNLFSLMYKINRDRIEFDITVTVGTLNQEIDVYKYIINTFLMEQTFSHVSSLEAMIPRPIICYLGKLSQNDITDPNKNQVPILLKYLNANSKYPITYKMRNASAQDEFFMYYNQTLCITMSDISLSDANKKGFADDTFEITFHMTVDFNLPGKFILLGDSEKNQGYTIDLTASNSSGTIKDYVPFYTMTNLYMTYKATLNGFRMYNSSMFKTDKDNTTDDKLNISEVFEDSYLSVIKDYNTFNTSIDTIVKLYILKDRVELVQGTDWKMDWNSMSLTLIDPDSESTYRLLVYVNATIINERLAKYQDNNNKDKSGL